KHPENGEALVVSQAKMSKSLGNVVNPDQVIDEYGADSLRLYEMFMGPLDQGKVWDTNGINGMTRFLKRVWSAMVGESEDSVRRELLEMSRSGDGDLDRALHRCIQQEIG